MGQVNFYPSGSVMGFWIFPMEIFHGLGKNFLFRFQVCISYALGSSVVPLIFRFHGLVQVKIATVWLEVWSNFGLGFDVTNL